MTDLILIKVEIQFLDILNGFETEINKIFGTESACEVNCLKF